MSELIADDLFLDRLAGRVDAGPDPLAGLLGALATQADTPLPSRTGRRRIANKHRYFGAFAALVVAASGAGVAAAVTLPANGPSQADRARIVTLMDDSARSSAPSGLLTRLGIPQTVGTTQAAGLVLARRADGTIVLLPAARATTGRPTAEAPGAAGAEASGNGQDGNGQDAKGSKAATGNGQGTHGTKAVTGNGQGGKVQGGASGADSQAVTPPATNHGKKPTAGSKGGKKVTPTPTPTTTASATDTVVPQTTLAPAATPTSQARTTRPGATKPHRSKPAPSSPSGAVTGVGAAVDGVVGTAVSGAAATLAPGSAANAGS
ncbi:hypothetical protein [Terrabacter aerolatus]|nr:hypothetical protein [Terrabacter aerolatus]